MNLIMSAGRRASTTAKASKTTFFQNVSQLDSLMASPKQPQSLMGSAMASHSVSGVNTAMMSSSRRDVARRWMANSRQMPMPNSTADIATDAASVRMSGTYWARCHASR